MGGCVGPEKSNQEKGQPLERATADKTQPI